MKYSSFTQAIVTVLCINSIGAQNSTRKILTSSSSSRTTVTSTSTELPSTKSGTDFRCTKTTAVVGELLKENLDTMKVLVTTTVAIKLNPGEAACIRVHFPDTSGANSSKSSLNDTTDNVSDNRKIGQSLNGTVLYYLQYIGLSQIYPIRQAYVFAVPQFESKCICDCPGGENHCAIGYNYRNCSKEAFCVTTYHPHQKATGCFAGEEAELCCDVTVTPYGGRKFAAVHLSQPSTAGKFAYRVYFLNADHEWSVKKSENFQVSLNHDHLMEFEDDKLELQISGTKSYWQLDSGMYFYEMGVTKNRELRTGVPVNELYEWNTGKLGWFRMQDDRWTVANGWVEIQDAHHVQVEHCKDQLYTDNYKAHYYTSVGKNKSLPLSVATALGHSSGEQAGIYLGRTVVETEPWIDSVILPTDNDNDNREIVVITKESPTLTVHMNLDSRVELRLYYHKSNLKDFSGAIQLDKFSNKYLNLTLINARGTILGAMYKSDSKASTDIAFSTNVDEVAEKTGNNAPTQNKTFILILPLAVNSTRYVCMKPLEKNVELCKWIEYRSEPLEHVDITREWSLNQAECPGCNEMTWNNFLSYLNPKQWFDGISSVSEAFAMIVEVGFYIVVILITVCVCRRCVCPLFKALMCGGGNSNSAKT